MAVLVIGSGVLASPASNLIDQLEALLKRYYVDLEVLDLPMIRASLTRAMNANCPNQQDCPASSIHAGLRETVRSLPDGQSSFRSGEELAALRTEQAGNPSADARLGLGLEVRPSMDGRDVVTRVLAGGPAERSGLKVGDVVLEVTHVGRSGPWAALRLENSSVVAFKLARLQDQLNLYVTPETGWRTLELLPASQVLEAPTGPVLVLRLPSFRAQGTAQRAVDALAAMPANARLVLDVRFNTGGFLDEALLLASALLDGPVLRVRSRAAIDTYSLGLGVLEVNNGQPVRQARLERPTRSLAEVTVLVNRSTAGAAELLASVLQRAKRALVLGEVTRGQAAIAVLPLTLADGSEVRLAASRNLFADGSPLPNWVTPDVQIPDDLSVLTQGRDVLLEAVLGR